MVDARVEHVGSLLRPEFLRDARDAYGRGELTPAGLKAAEDRAVRSSGPPGTSCPPEPDLNPSRGPWRAIRVPSARAPR